MAAASAWRITSGDNGELRLTEVVQRGFGSEAATWAELLLLRLRSVLAYVLYFPSRFDLDVDRDVQALLRTFGEHTSDRISVNFWDSKDPAFSQALNLFNLKEPPALVLATGLEAGAAGAVDPENLYMIAFTDAVMLRDRERVAHAVNTAVELLSRGDPDEIARYLRQRNVASILSTIGRSSSTLRDAIQALKPRIGLPGGISIGLG